MEKSIASILAASELFKGLDEERLKVLISEKGRTVKIRRGQPLPLKSGEDFAIILSGAAVICSENHGSRTILRFSKSPDPVGLAGLFSPNRIFTVIEACSDNGMTALIFSKQEYLSVMDADTDGTVRDNTLIFLSKRIAFLNTKINTVTAGSAKRRLASFILSSDNGSDVFDPGMSMTNLSNCLDIGRASLYRACEALEAENAASYSDSVFKILDRQLLIDIGNGSKY